MTYIALVLLAVGLIVALAYRGRNLRVGEAVLGFARSMDTSSMYARSRHRFRD